MNLIHHPELLERLASAYALGTLRGGARRRFEALAREHVAVRTAALVWQSRLASLNELQAAQAPAPAVWGRIEAVVGAELRPRRPMVPPAPPPLWMTWLRSLTLWRLGTAAGALATLVAVFTTVNLRQQLDAEVAQLQASAPVAYVAVLADDKASASMLVTFDPKSKKLLLQRVGDFRESADRSLQLWALPRNGGPRSLGVLGPDTLLRLTALEEDVRQVPTLAISLEPKGGVPSATGPTGPVLFKGALIQRQI